MTMDYQAGKNYTVKVVDGQGKALANQTVKIKAVNKIIATICPELKLVKIASIFINILPFYLTINC